MAFQAQFKRGHNIQTMNHTPVADVAAGDVVIVAGIVGIAVVPIKAGQLGALNISGGSYIVMADAIIAAGVDVYWVDATNKVTATAGANKFFGTTVEASTGDLDLFEVAHKAGGKTV